MRFLKEELRLRVRLLRNHLIACFILCGAIVLLGLSREPNGGFLRLFATTYPVSLLLLAVIEGFDILPRYLLINKIYQDTGVSKGELYDDLYIFHLNKVKPLQDWDSVWLTTQHLKRLSSVAAMGERLMRDISEPKS